MAAAVELVESGDPREISAVLASRFRMTKAQVDRYVAAHLAALRRAHATLTTGVANAVAMADETRSETEAEVLS